MTAPVNTPGIKPGQKQSAEFDLAEYFERNRRAVLSVGGGIVLAGLAFWFYSASAERKALRSEEAYAGAERAYYSGNAQLAQTDLQRVVERYGNTPAGARAAILLARAHYDAGKPADGVTVLRAALGRSAAKPFRASLNGMLGVGLESAGKFDSAATAFMAAASAEELDAERDLYHANAARAHMNAGNKTEAIALWERLAAREASPYATEARLRVAELKAAPASGT